MVGASIGGYVGWLTTARSEEAVQPVAYFSWFPIVCIVVLLLALILWYRRGVTKDKDDDARDRMLGEIHEHLLSAPSPEEVAAKGRDAARGVGSSIRVGAGNTFTVAVGAGPVRVTVPTEGRFGAGFPETVEFTLDANQHSLVLPNGGWVTILPSAAGHAEVTGHLRGQVVAPEETGER